MFALPTRMKAGGSRFASRSDDVTLIQVLEGRLTHLVKLQENAAFMLLVCAGDCCKICESFALVVTIRSLFSLKHDPTGRSTNKNDDSSRFDLIVEAIVGADFTNEEAEVEEVGGDLLLTIRNDENDEEIKVIRRMKNGSNKYSEYFIIQ